MRLPVPSSRLLYKIFIGAALAIGLAKAKGCYDANAYEKGVLYRAQKHLVDRNWELQKELDAADTRVRHDTVALNSAITRYVTLRDTIVITDTVQVKAALVACDSVVAESKVSVSSLALGIRVRDAKLANRDSSIAALNARFPSRLAQAGNAAKWALIGAGVDELFHAFLRRR